MRVAVGVDAGGSSTTAVAANGEVILGSATGSAANVRVAGVEAAADAIAAVVARALGDTRAQALFVGASGAGRRETGNELRDALLRRFSGTLIEVDGDARIALRADVPEGDGIVIVSGTGSLAYAEIGDCAFRSGGYGYLVGDEGSGFAIGSAAVRLLLRSYDGRASREGFFDAIESELAASDAQSVVERVYSAPVPIAYLSALAPVVLTAAQNGERSATKIVQAAALELFEMVKSIVRRAEIGDRPLRIVFAGRLLASNSLLTYLLETRLSNERPNLEPRKGARSPEFGALTLARRMLEA
jgi:N-acetylglucosamine kinase-like BadF-type ATPase